MRFVGDLILFIGSLIFLMYVANASIPPEKEHRAAILRELNIKVKADNSFESLLATAITNELLLTYGLDNMICEYYSVYGLRLGSHCYVETSKMSVDSYGAFGLVFTNKEPTKFINQ